MQILELDPRALKGNPDDARRSKSSPQADALLLATVKAVGIIQPPVVSPETDGGNGYIIQAGHRRVKQAIAAGLEEITVLVVETANDNGAMRSMVESIAREPLNPVDQWRGIERLVALGWTEEAIGVALALPVRQIRKLRLLANVLSAMLDHMALGDMPNEQQLRTIAAARSMLIDVLSCRRGMSNSGVVSRIAGQAIGADSFLPNMGSEDFLLCLSRQALEAAAKEVSVLPRQKVRETRAVLVEHFKEARFTHSSAIFAPDRQDITDFIKHGETLDDEEGNEGACGDEAIGELGGAVLVDSDDGFDPLDGDDDLPDIFDDAPEASELDEDQDAYGVAAE